MSLPWFRQHTEDLLTPPLATMLPADFKTFVQLQGIANRERDRGMLPSVSDIAFLLHMKEAPVIAFLNRMLALDLVEKTPLGYAIANRERFYKTGDDYNLRMQKSRDKLRNGLRNTQRTFPEPVSESHSLSVLSKTPKESESSFDDESRPGDPDRQTETVSATGYVTATVQAYAEAFPDWDVTQAVEASLADLVRQFDEPRVLYAIEQVASRPVRRTPIAAIQGTCWRSAAEGRRITVQEPVDELVFIGVTCTGCGSEYQVPEQYRDGYDECTECFTRRHSEQRVETARRPQ